MPPTISWHTPLHPLIQRRPALRRLMADIVAGKVDCVTVYKVDRLSRSLLDFAKMLEVFERHDVAFVSVTQQHSI